MVQVPDAVIVLDGSSDVRQVTGGVQIIAAGDVSGRHQGPQRFDGGADTDAARIAGLVARGAAHRSRSQVKALDISRRIRESKDSLLQTVGRNRAGHLRDGVKPASFVHAEDKGFVLYDWTAGAPSEAVVLDVGLGDSRVIVVPGVRVQHRILAVPIRRAMQLVRPMFRDQCNLASRGAVEGGDGVGNRGAKFVDRIGGSRNNRIGGDDALRYIDAVNSHRILIVNRAGGAHLKVAAVVGGAVPNRVHARLQIHQLHHVALQSRQP